MFLTRTTRLSFVQRIITECLVCAGFHHWLVQEVVCKWDKLLIHVNTEAEAGMTSHKLVTRRNRLFSLWGFWRSTALLMCWVQTLTVGAKFLPWCTPLWVIWTVAVRNKYEQQCTPKRKYMTREGCKWGTPLNTGIWKDSLRFHRCHMRMWEVGNLYLGVWQVQRAWPGNDPGVFVDRSQWGWNMEGRGWKGE
jgi:hypothetical protein